jgi:hypothetical protein
MIGYTIGEIGEFMMTKTEINIEEIDWECLHLLSKKEKIPVPDLIGRMISIRLEEYEDFQDALSLEIAMAKSEEKTGISLEEFCRQNDIQL